MNVTDVSSIKGQPEKVMPIIDPQHCGVINAR
jgi:hypothetical protein